MQEVLDIPDDANIRHSDGSYTESEFGGGSRSDLFLLLRTGFMFDWWSFSSDKLGKGA